MLALLLFTLAAGCGAPAEPPPAEPGRVVHSIAPAARAYPGLVALLDADAERGRAAMEAAPAGSVAARGWRKDWRVTAETRRLVAVAAERIAGADGGSVRTDAVLWDTRAGRRVTAERLFEDSSAAMARIESAFCDAIAAARGAEGAAPIACPGIRAGHFAWEAGGGARLIDRLSAHFPDPDPTSPGRRIVVPVPPELPPLIHADYRAEFAAGR